MEAHAVRQYLQLCAGALGQSTGQCGLGGLVCTPGGPKPLWKGRILTRDAAQSYHDFGRLVKREGGEDIIFIKDNTPAARADLELFFEDKQADRRSWQVDEQMEKGHGRLERRHITTSSDLND